MLQLKMLRPSAPVISRSLPEGYTFSTYRGTKTEVTDWLEICLHGQLITPEPPEGRTYEEWFNVTILEFADVNPSEDVIFVLDDTGRPVATLCVIKHGEDQGHIHMVGAHPSVRGKGIGHAMLALALTKLEERGCAYSFLATDDFRLAAIKTYLDAGYRPVLLADPESDHRARWDAIIATLGYEPVEYFDEV